MNLKIGDIVTLKKPHPCGSYDWEIKRTGIDFKLKCVGCQHLIMIPRNNIEKRIKKINNIKVHDLKKNK